VRSKANISHVPLNVPHGTKKLNRWKKKKLNGKKTDMLRSIGRQSGEYLGFVCLTKAIPRPIRIEEGNEYQMNFNG